MRVSHCLFIIVAFVTMTVTLSPTGRSILKQVAYQAGEPSRNPQDVLTKVQASKTGESSSKDPLLDQERVWAGKWLDAVAGTCTEEALLMARKICGKIGKIEQPGDYRTIGLKTGVPDSAFDGDFGDLDFRLWRDAFFFKSEALRITEGDPDAVKALLDAVCNVVKPVAGDSPGKLPWPRNVWERGFGICDRQSWVFCELCYQLGWETAIIITFEKEKMLSHHTLCEIRKFPSSCYTVDPYFGFLGSIGLGSIVESPNLLDRIWPGRISLHKELSNSMLMIPSYSQDFFARNIVLHEKLLKLIGKKCPRFGEDPSSRLAYYSALVRKQSESGRTFPLVYWTYPFQLYRDQRKLDTRKN